MYEPTNGVNAAKYALIPIKSAFLTITQRPTINHNAIVIYIMASRLLVAPAKKIEVFVLFLMNARRGPRPFFSVPPDAAANGKSIQTIVLGPGHG